MTALSMTVVLLLAALTQQSFSGTLEESDPLWEGSRRHDEYSFTAEARQRVTVRMTSSEFDTYLIVQSADGVTHSNDDYESTSVSQVDFVSREAGEWKIIAAAFGADAAGDYTVEVTLGPIAEVETISGRLDPNDEEAIKGEYYDTHMIQVDGDGEFSLELNCYGFDGYLVARSPSGETWRNDDAGDTSRSRISGLSGTGEWTVYVTTSAPGAMGAYDLDVIR